MRLPPFLFVLLLLTACAGIPAITPFAGGDAHAGGADSPFVTGSRRLIHSISGNLPGGATASMIGVFAFEERTGRIRFSLMSIEGLVFLDAEHDGGLVIHRAIGPFSSPAFVAGMIRDIRLILFAPPGKPVESGTLPDGSRVARYRSEETVTDVIRRESGEIEVAVYGASRTRERVVRYSAGRRMGMPERIDFTAAGTPAYSLVLELIETEETRD